MAQTSRIMLVEDEVIIALDVSQRLETLGYQVVHRHIGFAQPLKHCLT